MTTLMEVIVHHVRDTPPRAADGDVLTAPSAASFQEATDAQSSEVFFYVLLRRQLPSGEGPEEHGGIERHGGTLWEGVGCFA